MQSPPEFAAISAVVVAGSIIGTACAIRPKQRDDWTVYPNLWGACIGRPTVVMKTPSMREPMSNLERLQAQAAKEYEDDLKDYEANMEIHDIEQRALKKNSPMP